LLTTRPLNKTLLTSAGCMHAWSTDVRLCALVAHLASLHVCSFPRSVHGTQRAERNRRRRSYLDPVFAFNCLLSSAHLCAHHHLAIETNSRLREKALFVRWKTSYCSFVGTTISLKYVRHLSSMPPIFPHPPERVEFVAICPPWWSMEEEKEVSKKLSDSHLPIRSKPVSLARLNFSPFSQ
jgi:hypothetical protein